MPIQTILCAVDAERDVYPAVVRAVDLAERTHADLHLLHADPVPRPSMAGREGSPVDALFADRVAYAVDQALGVDGAFGVVGPEVHVVHSESARDAIIRVAGEVGADVVVTGTHATRGLARALTGSTAAETVRRSPVPVLVVPEGSDGIAPGPGRPVVAAVDFSAMTAGTLAWAADLAATMGAQVELAHALDGPLDLGGLLTLGDLSAGPSADTQAQAREALGQVASAAGLDPGAVHVVTGAPESALVRLAEARGAGALVLGTHGRTGWDRLRLGSVAEWVVRHAGCPVLTVPAGSATSE